MRTVTLRSAFDFQSFRDKNKAALDDSLTSEKTFPSQRFPKTNDLDQWIRRIDLLTAHDCYALALGELEESLSLYPDNKKLDDLLAVLIKQTEFVGQNMELERTGKIKFPASGESLDRARKAAGFSYASSSSLTDSKRLHFPPSQERPRSPGQ